MIAYCIEEVQNPIREEDQTKANDVHLNAAEAKLEFTTTIKNLQVECLPDLEAKISSKVSPSDPNINIVTVIIPIASLTNAKKAIEDAEKERIEVTRKIDNNLNNLTNEERTRLDKLETELENKKNIAEDLFKQLTNIAIYAEGTNRLSIDISDIGPRIKLSLIHI